MGIEEIEKLLEKVTPKYFGADGRMYVQGTRVIEDVETRKCRHIAIDYPTSADIEFEVAVPTIIRQLLDVAKAAKLLFDLCEYDIGMDKTELTELRCALSKIGMRDDMRGQALESTEKKGE